MTCLSARAFEVLPETVVQHLETFSRVVRHNLLLAGFVSHFVRVAQQHFVRVGDVLWSLADLGRTLLPLGRLILLLTLAVVHD